MPNLRGLVQSMHGHGSCVLVAVTEISEGNDLK